MLDALDAARELRADELSYVGDVLNSGSRSEDFCDVLIVGGGFGGVFCGLELESHIKRAPKSSRKPKVVLVSEQNFLLFSPLLPEAASGTLEPRHCVTPIRQVLKQTQVVTGRVSSIDKDAKRVVLVDVKGREIGISYQVLVLAPGAVPSIFPIPGLVDNANGFKSLADAIWLRNRVLSQLEAAEATQDPIKKRELLTFTFIGGGYAGIEALAELESLSKEACEFYPKVSPSDFRWVMIEATSTLLPGISERLARYSEEQLRKRGVEFHFDTRLVSCEDFLVVTDDPKIEPFRSATIVWTAGQKPSHLPKDAGFKVDGHGKVEVNEFMQVVGAVGVYALGDCANVPDPGGGFCPGTAQHAMRQGRTAGRGVAADFQLALRRPFTYRTRGLAVTLGKGEGTAEIFGRTFTGWVAWWMGRAYHLVMMPGLARRVRVLSDWLAVALSERDLAELGDLGHPAKLDEPVSKVFRSSRPRP